MSLRPYQLDGIEFLATAKSAAILADEPGLGKSAQAIVAAERLGLDRILIVCPAIGRVSWPIELGKWDLSQRAIVMVGRNAPPPLGKPAVTIVSYDLLSRGGNHAVFLDERAKAGEFDLLILDEGQYLKDTGAKRTKFVYRQLARHIPNTWVLSGTPTPNHNGELYPHIVSLFPQVARKLFPEINGRLPHRTEFEDKFCKVEVTPFGRTIKGNRNTSDLRKALEPHLLRRRATEVKDELPPLTIEELEFDGDAVVAMLSPEQVFALNEAGAAFDAAYTNTGLTPELVDSFAIHIATERRALGLAKVPLASAWAIDLLESGQDKLILFAHHKDVIASLMAALLDYDPVGITGDTLSLDRAKRVGQFQSDPAIRVLVGNIQAAGTSITLTASNRVGIVEPSWTPGDNTQAIRRSYRIGQTRAVTATYLSVATSLDSNITKTLIRKAGDIAALLDQEENA